MKIFPPSFEVSLDEGFSAEKDLFGRAPIAAGLTRLVERVEQPMVIGLDGEWGSGKTTFLRFWTGELRKAGYPVIFFDSFQNDYADDAFLALAGEVFAALEEHNKGRSPAAKKFVSKAAAAGKVLLRTSLKIGVKAATMGTVNATDLEDLSDAISDGSAEAFDETIGEMITGQQAHRDAIAEFKAALEKLPALISPPADDEKQKPLVFIIDELDRCKPSFALELLERVKHFFSVPNVHFVLGINSEQLGNSVRAVYGQGIDAKTYLQKFIHLTWTLSQRERYASDRSRTKYAKYLLANLGVDQEDYRLAEYAIDLASSISEVKQLSFRAIERIVSVIAIAVATTPPNHYRPAPLVGGLAVMKVLNPNLFDRAKRGGITYDEVRKFLEFDALADFESHNWSGAIQAWQFATDANPPQELLQQMSGSLTRYDLERRDILPYTADVVMDNITLR